MKYKEINEVIHLGDYITFGEPKARDVYYITVDGDMDTKTEFKDFKKALDSAKYQAFKWKKDSEYVAVDGNWKFAVVKITKDYIKSISKTLDNDNLKKWKPVAEKALKTKKPAIGYWD
jgi:predicted phosphodiesterase